MNTIIVYVSYDHYEYINYYHLIINGDILIKYCPEEKIDDLFQKIYAIKNELKNSEIYIIQDENASQWDYLEIFQKCNFVLQALDDKDSSKLCNIMNSVPGIEFNSEKVKVLFYGKVIFKDECYKTNETLRQAEEILKQGGEDMTELARIIKEKYERMNRHD